jgi:hypothetical protein
MNFMRSHYLSFTNIWMWLLWPDLCNCDHNEKHSEREKSQMIRIDQNNARVMEQWKSCWKWDDWLNSVQYMALPPWLAFIPRFLIPIIELYDQFSNWNPIVCNFLIFILQKKSNFIIGAYRVARSSRPEPFARVWKINVSFLRYSW